MAFIDPVTLEGKHVRIEPLARGHEEGVKSAASDGELWRLWYTSVPAPAKTGEWIDAALDMRAKLGLFTAEDGDKALVDDLLDWMQRHDADFTNTFVALTRGLRIGDDGDAAAWQRRWTERRARQPQPAAEGEGLMRRHNPAVIPRNHLVEAALQAATDHGDVSVMGRLLDVLAAPYDHDRDLAAFTAPAPDATPYRTFCGT